MANAKLPENEKRVWGRIPPPKKHCLQTQRCGDNHRSRGCDCHQHGGGPSLRFVQHGGEPRSRFVQPHYVRSSFSQQFARQPLEPSALFGAVDPTPQSGRQVLDVSIYFREARLGGVALGNDDDVEPGRKLIFCASPRFTNQALGSIANNGVAHFFAYGNSQPSNALYLTGTHERQ
jgi:hypothetical protein